MNRYALEMHAREKNQNFESATARNLSTSTGSLRLGFLSRRMARLDDYPSKPTRDDSMTFIYELRCELIDVELDDILPLVK
jgi:hypothetical protein